MNKIYKVIWSKTRNCYVAVSELAKSHTKASLPPGKKARGLAGRPRLWTLNLSLLSASGRRKKFPWRKLWNRYRPAVPGSIKR